MKKIQVNSINRTFAMMFIFVLILCSLITSATQNIPDVHNDLETYIKNSNGNYWESNASNIQMAINDLDNNSGTVWLPGNMIFELSSTLILHQNVILDLGGCIIKPSGDFNIIDIRESTTLKNGIIDVSGIDTFDHACIYINGIHFIDTHENTTKIFNMELRSANQQGKGIFFHVDDDRQGIGWVRCHVISTNAFEYGILLQCDNDGESYGSWINGNTFTDLRGRNDKYFIYIERNTNVKEPWSAVGGNIFETIQFQTTKNTQCVIYNEGWGNMFSNLMLWDWQLAGSGKTSILFTHDSQQCFLSFRGGSADIIDNGARNTIIDYGKSEIISSSIQSETLLLDYLQIVLLLVLIIFIFYGIVRFRKNRK